MNQLEFKLSGHPYIELVKLLKIMSLVGTGGEAKMRIADGEATYNGETETRKRKKLYDGDVVTFANTEIKIIA